MYIKERSISFAQKKLAIDYFEFSIHGFRWFYIWSCVYSRNQKFDHWKKLANVLQKQIQCYVIASCKEKFIYFYMNQFIISRYFILTNLVLLNKDTDKIFGGLLYFGTSKY